MIRSAIMHKKNNNKTSGQVYEPEQDSFLLERIAKKYAKGRVLDMGTGSGIIACASADNAEEVVAADINPEAIRFSEKHCRRSCADPEKITFVISDLFSSVKGKFDRIFFNAPYLPQDKGIIDDALYGGKHGYETAVRFINLAGDHLEMDGEIFLLISTLTGISKVEEAIQQNLFEPEIIAEKKLWMEKLIVYRIIRSELRKEIEKKGISHIRHLAHGKRGTVHTGMLDAKKVAVKSKYHASDASGRISHEGNMLEKVNKLGIGPKLMLKTKNFVVYLFAEGVCFPEFIRKASYEEIKKALEELIRQCRILDKNNIDKEEMHRPYKHIIIGRKITMIDFERAHFTLKPHNTTQFLKYLISGNIHPVLKKKRI